MKYEEISGNMIFIAGKTPEDKAAALAYIKDNGYTNKTVKMTETETETIVRVR